DGPHAHLRHQTPARGVERGERRLRDLAGPPVLAPLHVPGEALHVERIGSDDVARRQFLDAGVERLGLVHHPHFADADEAIIGGELEKQQFAPGSTDNGGSCLAYLHAATIPAFARKEKHARATAWQARLRSSTATVATADNPP